jgi:hypothetical protein
MTKLTVKELRENLSLIPDDYEIWIEYPERYELHSPVEIDKGIFDNQDAIQALAYGHNNKKKRFYILHHY